MPAPKVGAGSEGEYSQRAGWGSIEMYTHFKYHNVALYRLAIMGCLTFRILEKKHGPD